MATAKIEWRSNTPNKTVTRFLQLIRDFAIDQTANGGRWNLLYDNSTDVAAPYFVITYNRNTPYPGDNPIVMVSSTVGANPTISVRAYESFEAPPGVNLASAHASDLAGYSLTNNTDFWITASPTHFLVASSFVNGLGTGIYAAHGVACIERLTGDSDSGTFYGQMGVNAWSSTKSLYVPKRWDGALTTSAVFNISNVLNNTDNRGLIGTDEAGKHAIFDMAVSRPDFGKLKGKLYGVATATYGQDLAPGLFLPDSTSPEWLVTKGSTTPDFAVLMAVSAPIQVKV